MGFYPFSALFLFIITSLCLGFENTGSFTSGILQNCDNFTVLASLHWFAPLLAFVILKPSKSADTEPIHGQ